MLLTRRAPAVLIPALLAVSLTACGSEKPAAETFDRLDAVTITGDVGAEPVVEWKGEMKAGDIEAETLVTGDGPALADKDEILAQIWIGNGFVQDQAYSTYDEDSKAELITIDDTLPPFLASIKGATVGSRIAVTSSAESAFGEAGNSTLGIGNKDSILVIIDLASTIADAPSGERSPAPSWMPPMEFEKGDPAKFTFDGVEPPNGELRKAVLLAGEGPVVEKGQTVVAQYLGQTFGGAAPFDENFTSAPTTFRIGVGSVVKGWDQAIVGATVGTRMVIEVPPALGYGDKGNKQAGIKGKDTLVFVIDILAAG